jgi:hypothetical protein
MDNNQGGSSNTGTRDVTYDLTAVLYHALQGIENCQTYSGDAQGKEEHRRFFQMAIQGQQRLAEEAKRLLHDCLMQETGGGNGSSQGSMGQGAGMSSVQSQSFAHARDDDSASRSASSQTEGGSDQFGGGASMDREGGSALRSGQQSGGAQNDAAAGEFGQDALGQGQRHSEMTTGGGGTSSF